MIFRLLARRCKVSKDDAKRLTFSQALNLLDESDPNDPHRGNRPVRCQADIEAAIRRLYEED